MMFTIEQKEQITEIFALIYRKINRAKHIAGALENSSVFDDGMAPHLKDARETLESGERYVDKLKELLMQIDRENHGG